MDLIQGTNLMEFVKEEGKLCEGTARKFMKQLLGAIEYLHYKEVCHRDIKPENIVVTAGKKI